MSILKSDLISNDKLPLPTSNMKHNDEMLPIRKENSIMLNLNQKGNMFSDLTPTPTRFLRNCEEVGLFQDLQNVNPFDETFRRATEAVKNGQPLQFSPLCPNEIDDTLHTPNVFPMLPESQHVEKLPEQCPPKEAAYSEEVTQVEEPSPPRKYVRKRKKVDLEPTPKDKVLPYIILNNNVTFKLPLPKMPPAIKVYKPDYFSVFAKHNSKALEEPSHESRQRKSKGIIQQFKKSDDNNANKLGNVSHDESNALPQKRSEVLTRNEIMERNRIAAIRTRQKKKHYLASLEKLNKTLSQVTADLDSKVRMLSRENTELKERLSKCKCTKTQTSYRHISQQTDSTTTNKTKMLPKDKIASGSAYLEINIAKEMEEKAFYATIPEPQTSQIRQTCQILNPLSDVKTKCFLRKPFKKRNLN